MKVSIIGAGNVGTMTAMRIAEGGLADVILLDVAKGLSLGKALDLSHASSIIGHNQRIEGTEQYEDIKDSQIVIITAGITRSPDMTREDLFIKNSRIVKDVTGKIKIYAPDSIIIVVTNPLDIMSYLAYRVSGFGAKKVFGMAGILDSARFNWFISQELNLPVGEIKTIVLGGHGDSMVCLPRFSTAGAKPITELLSGQKINRIIDRTRRAGAEIVSFLGRGSAYLAPSAAIYTMVRSIILDQKKTFPVSAYLEGQYGLKGIYLGAPVKLGRNGAEEIVELALNKQELQSLHKSADVIRKGIENLMSIP
ncbi:MAG: malate dehydrogenase [Candidatus Omnitrophota bacterium]|nr:malate dehydrogenase [Candidatus Omnitrophota bacterium]